MGICIAPSCSFAQWKWGRGPGRWTRDKHDTNAGSGNLLHHSSRLVGVCDWCQSLNLAMRKSKTSKLRPDPFFFSYIYPSKVPNKPSTVGVVACAELLARKERNRKQYFQYATHQPVTSEEATRQGKRWPKIKYVALWRKSSFFNLDLPRSRAVLAQLPEERDLNSDLLKLHLCGFLNLCHFDVLTDLNSEGNTAH